MNYSGRQPEASGVHDESALTGAMWLVGVYAVVLLFGLCMLYSTSGQAGSVFFIKQVIWAGVGISAAVAVNLIGYRQLAKLWLPLLALTVVLLVAALFCPARKGAHRWISIPGVGNLQPSELAKLTLVIFLSKYLAENMRFMERRQLASLIAPGLICVLVLGLIFIGKDWGTTFLLAATAWLMFFAAGTRLRYLILPLAFVPPLFFYLRNFDPERWSRMVSFLDPEAYQSDDAYQLWHSLLAFGSGKWFGLGFGGSRMKAEYLPEAHTDFILAIVGEELGLVFMLAVILAYAIILTLSIKISAKASTRQGSLLAFGIACLISLQAIINIGVVSGAFPTKGMPAPLISYGGSNLLMTIIGIGLLFNIALDSAGGSPWRDIAALRRLREKRGGC